MADRAVAPATAFAVGTLGIALFSWMDALMKALTLAMGTYNTLLWRCLAGTVLSGVVYAAMRLPRPGRAVMRVHLVRGVVSTAMAVLFFWGLARMPMAQAIALAYIAPIIALFLAAAMLRERVGRPTIVATAVACVGIATILTGQARADLGPDALLGALSVLASALCYAFNILLMRQQSLIAGPVEVAFWQSLIVTACLLPAAPWLAHLPTAAQLPGLLVAAILATASLALLGWAYAHGEASYLAPTEYTSFAWAAALGWLVYGEALSPWTVAGALLIVGGCVIAARRGRGMMSGATEPGL